MCFRQDDTNWTSGRVLKRSGLTVVGAAQTIYGRMAVEAISGLCVGVLLLAT